MAVFQAPKAVVLILHGGAGWLGPQVPVECHHLFSETKKQQLDDEFQ